MTSVTVSRAGRSLGGMSVSDSLSVVARISAGSLGLLLALVGALAFAAPAHACSCAAEPAKKRLKRADAAAEVKVLSVRDRTAPGGAVPLVGPDSDGTDSSAVFRVRLLAVHKGPKRLRSARTLKIRSYGDEGTCGLPRREGWKTGLLLRREGRRWTSSLCEVIGRKELRRAAKGKRQRSRPAMACARA